MPLLVGEPKSHLALGKWWSVAFYSRLVESLNIFPQAYKMTNKCPIFQEKKNRITGKYQGLGARSQQLGPAFLPICLILLLLIPVVGNNYLMGLLVQVKTLVQSVVHQAPCLAPPQV